MPRVKCIGFGAFLGFIADPATGYLVAGDPIYADVLTPAGRVTRRFSNCDSGKFPIFFAATGTAAGAFVGWIVSR